MNRKNLSSLLPIVLFISGVHSVQIVKQNHELVTVERGEKVELICTANVEVKTCGFRSPNGDNFLFFGAAYEEGRLDKYQGTEKDCGLVINSVEDKDNGVWECSVGGLAQGQALTVKSEVEVIVAVPPTNVVLRIGDRVGLSEYQVKMDEHQDGEPVLVDCVAEGSRPAPSFTWSIGDTVPINGQVETVVEEEGKGKATYTQTLEYYPKTEHNDQELKCVVDHQGYLAEQLANAENEVSVNLNILYAPVGANKEEVFYDLKEGQANEIRMQIYANPKPTEGIWKLGDQELAVGAESVDKKYKSTTFTEGTIDGQWIVALTINQLAKEDSQMENQLQISNNEGTAVYGFKLALGAKPPAEGGLSSVPIINGESSSGLAIGVVVVIALIVLLLILIVVARSKGMLCFAAKGSDEHDEEKEAFDNVEKGEAALIAQEPKDKAAGDATATKISPEKKNLTSGDDAKKDKIIEDEKKSNGAHTPV